MNNSAKYDDLTLMQYADGELDKVVSKQLEQDLVDNQELQDRLLVFTATREAMIGINTKIPKHLENLIDKHSKIYEDNKVVKLPEKSSTQNDNIGDGSLAYGTDNKVANFFRDYPIQSLAASVMFGLLIGSQGMQELRMSPQNEFLKGDSFKMMKSTEMVVYADKPVKNRPLISKRTKDASDSDASVTLSTQIQGVALTYADISSDISQTTHESLKEEVNNKVVATRSLASGATFEATYNGSEALKYKEIVFEFIDKLKNDSTIKEGEVKVKGGSVQLIHSFINTNKQSCKLIEINDQYSIICQGDDKKWNVIFNSFLDPELAVKF